MGIGTLAGQLHDIFHNEHYTSVREEAKARKLFEQTCARSSPDELALTAREHHEQIHTATKGVYRFLPGHAIRQEGMHTVVDPSGKDGFPLSWYLDADEQICELLSRSSAVESELWRRVAVQNQLLRRSHMVFGTLYSADALTATSQHHHRDTISTSNSKPLVVESAFYHLPGCKERYCVEGFSYPHPVSTWRC